MDVAAPHTVTKQEVQPKAADVPEGLSGRQYEDEKVKPTENVGDSQLRLLERAETMFNNVCDKTFK